MGTWNLGTDILTPQQNAQLEEFKKTLPSGEKPVVTSAKPVTPPAVTPSTPAQIAAAQNAAANNGKALVNMQSATKPKITVSPLLPDEGALQKTIKADTEKLAQLRRQLGKAQQKTQRQELKSQIGQLRKTIRKNQEKLSNASRIRQQIAKQIQGNTPQPYAEAASSSSSAITKAVAQGAASGIAKKTTEALINNKQKEKAHFDKLYDGVVKEGKEAKAALASRTDRYKELLNLGLSKKEAYEASKTAEATAKAAKTAAGKKAGEYWLNNPAVVAQREAWNKTAAETTAKAAEKEAGKKAGEYWLNNPEVVAQREAWNKKASEGTAKGTKPAAEAAKPAAKPAAKTTAKTAANAAKDAKGILASRGKRYRALVKLGIDKKEALEISKDAKKTAAKIKEKAHFNKVFKGIETQSDAAQKALKEKVTAYKKGGLFKRISKFFTTNGKGGNKFITAVKKHKVISGIIAALAIGGTIYAMSGDDENIENQVS